MKWSSYVVDCRACALYNPPAFCPGRAGRAPCGPHFLARFLTNGNSGNRDRPAQSTAAGSQRRAGSGSRDCALRIRELGNRRFTCGCFGAAGRRHQQHREPRDGIRWVREGGNHGSAACYPRVLCGRGGQGRRHDCVVCRGVEDDEGGAAGYARRIHRNLRRFLDSVR